MRRVNSLKENTREYLKSEYNLSHRCPVVTLTRGTREYHHRGAGGLLLFYAPPLLLKTGKGETTLEKGRYAYIAPDRTRLAARWAAAAVLVAGLVVGAFSVFGEEPGPSWDRILASGYQAVDELPPEYTELVPGLTAPALYAGDNLVSEWDRIDKPLRVLICEFAFRDIHDPRLMAFYKNIMDNPAVSVATRSTALHRLRHEAKYMGMDDLCLRLSHYRLFLLAGE
jgi:hypothetical protein